VRAPPTKAAYSAATPNSFASIGKPVHFWDWRGEEYHVAFLCPIFPAARPDTSLWKSRRDRRQLPIELDDLGKVAVASPFREFFKIGGGFSESHWSIPHQHALQL
jgi:hypothetical protein